MRPRLIAPACAAMLVSVIACSSPGPTPIVYGADVCEYCRMTIADKAFGCERVTKKGRVHKFDSIECLAAAELDAVANPADVHSRWVIDFAKPDRLINLQQAVIVATEQQTSPMGVGLVAVADRAEADRLIADKGGHVVSWDEVKLLVAERWNLQGE